MSGKRKDTLPPDPPQLSHPLIDALFWMFGRSESPSNGNEGKGISASNSTGELGGNGVSPYHAAQYSHGSSNSNNSDEREARRSLSWKDEMLDEKLAEWHEFIEVKGPDMPLADGTTDNSPHKTDGVSLARTQQNAGGRNNSTDSLGSNNGTGRRSSGSRSPNSAANNWGFFVSITPPTDLYPREENHKKTTQPHGSSVESEGANGETTWRDK